MPTIDKEAMRFAILAELARQGIEFAQVKPRENYPDEIHFIILLHTEAQLRPDSVERCRVNNQIAEAAAKANAKSALQCPWCKDGRISEAWKDPDGSFGWTCSNCGDCEDHSIPIARAKAGDHDDSQ